MVCLPVGSGKSGRSTPLGWARNVDFRYLRRLFAPAAATNQLSRLNRFFARKQLWDFARLHRPRKIVKDTRTHNGAAKPEHGVGPDCAAAVARLGPKNRVPRLQQRSARLQRLERENIPSAVVAPFSRIQFQRQSV